MQPLLRNQNLGDPDGWTKAMLRPLLQGCRLRDYRSKTTSKALLYVNDTKVPAKCLVKKNDVIVDRFWNADNGQRPQYPKLSQKARSNLAMSGTMSKQRANNEQTSAIQAAILKHSQAQPRHGYRSLSEALACPSSWQLGKACWQLPRLLITNPATNAARNAYRPNAVLSLLYRGQVTCVPSPPTVKSLSQSFCCKLEYRMTGSKSKDAQRCQLEQNVQPKKT